MQNSNNWGATPSMVKMFGCLTRLQTTTSLQYILGKNRQSSINLVSGEETPYRRGLILPALGLHFPGIKDPNAPKRYVSYRLNRVAQGELELDGDDLSDDDNED